MQICLQTYTFRQPNFSRQEGSLQLKRHLQVGTVMMKDIYTTLVQLAEEKYAICGLVVRVRPHCSFTRMPTFHHPMEASNLRNIPPVSGKIGVAFAS